MKNIICFLITIFLIACHTDPQPLVAGKDECYFCKMPVADVKFGGEIITAKGKLYKFDDMGCLVNFLKGGIGAEEKSSQILAMNYNNHVDLIEAAKAVFARSPD